MLSSALLVCLCDWLISAKQSRLLDYEILTKRWFSYRQCSKYLLTYIVTAFFCRERRCRIVRLWPCRLFTKRSKTFLLPLPHHRTWSPSIQYDLLIQIDSKPRFCADSLWRLKKGKSWRSSDLRDAASLPSSNSSSASTNHLTGSSRTKGTIWGKRKKLGYVTQHGSG